MRHRDSAASRKKILGAATREFVDKGFDGARMDAIALRSAVSKNLLYHYFGSKEQLFIAVLEQVYQTLRDHQSDLSIRGMEPEEGMQRLVEFTGEVWMKNPNFLRILSSENLHQARHVRRSDKIVKMYNPLLQTLDELLRRGVAKGVFRNDVDPVDLYISISALTAHYVTNRHTFNAVFNTNLMAQKRVQQRLRHAADVILSYLLRTEPAPGKKQRPSK